MSHLPENQHNPKIEQQGLEMPFSSGCKIWEPGVHSEPSARVIDCKVCSVGAWAQNVIFFFFLFSILAHEHVKGTNVCLPTEFQENLTNFNALKFQFKSIVLC